MTCIEGDFPAFVAEGSMEAGVVMIPTGNSFLIVLPSVVCYSFHAWKALSQSIYLW
jgi:hypothetical protein